MNRLIKITGICLGMLLVSKSDAVAQSFNSYQTIGRHTVSFSLIWQAKPQIGFSYTFRNFTKSFSDWQTEIRFPIDNGINQKEFTVISGMHRPSQLKRNFIGTGLHLVWEHSESSKFGDRLQGLVTAIPSYVYAASINDGWYGTSGLRLSYAPIIWSKTETDDARHNVHLGLHLDAHHERTLGLSINPKYTFHLGDEESNDFDGDFYFGQTYFLKRN